MSVISIVKQLNEKIPYGFKKPFSGLIRRQLIDHPVFIETMKTLEKADSMTEEEIKTLQMKRLKSVLIHAASHSPYYHDLFRRIRFEPEFFKTFSDLELIPVLTKTELKKHYNEILADDIHDSYEVSTGGSTGEPTKIQMERDAIYREWGFIYHFWAKFGYDFHSSKLATLRGVNMVGKISEINPLYSEVRLNPFMLTPANFQEYLNEIDKYNADYIYGYPSLVYNFCRIAHEKKINLAKRFKTALLISENLYPHQESFICDILQCSCAIFYGHTERAVFAERQNSSGYLFHPLYGYTEIAQDGSLIVTSFLNKKTPLIRYAVDDYVQPLPDGSWQLIGHRSSDYLYGRNGERLSMSAINFHDGTFDGIKAYQFEQHETGKCVLNLIPDDSFSNDQISSIRFHVDKKLGSGFETKVQIVKEIQLSSRGKYQMLLQYIKDDLNN